MTGTPSASEGPTTDFAVAVARFIALIEAQPGQRVAPSKGRWLARKAVYGEWWTPDRVGEVSDSERVELRALASQIIQRVFPGGALATSVTASHVQSTLLGGSS